MRKLRAEGVEATSKHTGPFSREDENKLWRAMETQSPHALLNDNVTFFSEKFCNILFC